MKYPQRIAVAAVISLLAVSTGYSADTAPANIAIDFAKTSGRIRALHGVNNGPVNWSIGADLTNYHKGAGFPSTRLHDCHYAGQNVVDIHFIFPIFDADADDPAYYRFAETDAYLKGIVECGEQITYRLGESIECRSKMYSNGGFYVQPPKDFAKWAKICVNIIRHYNDGWAAGFHYNIKYWEIWNEPSDMNPGMWPAPFDQYLKLYETVATAIKAYDPSLKVGGPAVCNIGFAPVVPFLEYCRDRKLPLDFFTWHCYDATPEAIARDAVTARKAADDYGFTNAESHITEWHPMWYSWDGDVDANELGNPKPEKYAAMRDKFDAMRGPKAAAFIASTLMLLQDCPLDMANYYTADTNPWGMFDGFGVPGRAYYAMVAFNQLAKTPNRVVCGEPDTPQPGITICAGLSDDKKTASILVSNFDDARHPVSLSIQNLPIPQPIELELFAVNAEHEFSSIQKSTLAADHPTLPLELSEHSVYLVRLGIVTSK